MSRTRTMWLEPNRLSVVALREELIGDGAKRGITGKFRAAVRSGIHFWRGHYAKHHFEKIAYWRYGYQYPNYQYETKTSQSGQSRTVEGVVLRPKFSDKMVRQARKHVPVSAFDNQLPLVFTGNTRRAILGGPFATRVHGNVMRGSWQGSGICWAWLARTRLKGGLTSLHPQEKTAMCNHIRSAFHVFMEQKGNLDYRDEQLLQVTGVSF